MPSKNRITLALTEGQMQMLEEHAATAAHAEGRAVSPAEIVRRALADHFGPAWPDSDTQLTWGGFSPVARHARWAQRSEDTMWQITWERFFGGQLTPEEYLKTINREDLEEQLRADLAARWDQAQANMTEAAESLTSAWQDVQQGIDSAAASLAKYLAAVQQALDDHKKR